MFSTTSAVGKATSGKRLRAACDNCHSTKVKCTGSNPCERCSKMGFDCVYSTSNRMGRPKNTLNKKTVERIRHSQEAKRVTVSQGNLNILQNGSLQAQLDLEAAQAATIDTTFGLQTRLDDNDVFQRLTSTNREDSLDVFSGVEPFADDQGLISPFGAASELSTMRVSTGSTDYEGSSRSMSLSSLTKDVNLESALSDDDFGSSNDLNPALGFADPKQTFPSRQAMPSNMLDDSPYPDSDVKSVHGDTHTSVCGCLTGQMTLILKLKKLERAWQASCDIGIPFITVSQALASWEAFLQCHKCNTFSGAKEGDTAEVMELVAMNAHLTMRVMNSVAQGLHSTSPQDYPTPTTPLSQHAHRSSKPGTTSQEQGQGCSNSRLGAYKLTDKEENLVTAVLLFRVITQLQVVLTRLQQSAQQVAHWICGGGGSTPASGDDDMQDALNNILPLDVLRDPFEGPEWRDTPSGRASRSSRNSSSTMLANAHAAEKIRQWRHLQGMFQRLQDNVRGLKTQIRACVGWFI